MGEMRETGVTRRLGKAGPSWAGGVETADRAVTAPGSEALEETRETAAISQDRALAFLDPPELQGRVGLEVRPTWKGRPAKRENPERQSPEPSEVPQRPTSL